MAKTILSKRDIRAGEVCAELQDWIDNVEGVSTTPIVSLTVASTTTTIEIGGMAVWDDQVNDEAELNFDYCKAAYQDEIRDLAAYTR